MNDKYGIADLPQSWVLTTLGEVCLSSQYGWTTSASKKGDLHLLRTTDITQGNIDWSAVPFCQNNPPDIEKYLLYDGDILISRAGSVGYSYLVKNPKRAVFASYLIRFRPLIEGRYLSFFLKSPNYWKSISEKSIGIALANVNASKLRQIVVPLAPLAEQSRIADKVEEFFSFRDAGVESLRKAQAQLKRYRQAVLKYAFEGKLTEEWRVTHKDQIEPAQELLNRIRERRTFKEKTTSAQPVNVSNEARLPTNWATASLDELSEQIVDCLHSTPKFTTEGKYCIDTNCIEPNKILFGKARLVSEETFRERIRRLKPKSGDILFAREGTIGTAIVVPENVDLCIGQRMMMFRPDKEVNPSYFMLGLLSPFFERQWKTKVTGSTVAHINVKDVRLMRLPLASVVEQELISKEVERLLSIADDLEKTLVTCLLHSDLMRQSILKSAFEGALVPQNPNDEPAENLLERIIAERIKNGKNKTDNQMELSRYVQ